MLDLLDDWTQHYAFRSVRTQVLEAYAAAFARADVVTANGGMESSMSLTIKTFVNPLMQKQKK